jgi:hypothetical protein
MTFLRWLASAVLCFVAACAHAQVTGFYYKSTPGDYIGQGATVKGLPPEWSISLGDPNGGGIIHVGASKATESWSMSFAAPRGATIAANAAYEEATRYPFGDAAPSLSMTGNSRGCNQVFGRFAVIELVRDASGAIFRLAIDFEQRCERVGPPLYGEVRINSTVPFTVDKPAGTVTPGPYALNATPIVGGAWTVASNLFTVYGINAPAPISISGGTYSIDGGPYTSAPGMVENAARVRVSMTSSSLPGTVNHATLNVGGRTAALRAVTFGAGNRFTGLYLDSDAGDYIGQGRVSYDVAPPSQILVSAYAAARSEAAFTFYPVTGESWSFALSAPSGGELKPGTYEGATRYPFQGTGPGLSFSGQGRGCNQLTGRFVIHDIAFDVAGKVQRLAADFEQHCEGGLAALYGEFNYNSSFPFGIFGNVAGKNVALAANGATAIASSTYSAGFPPSAAINGDAAGRDWGVSSGWNDATLKAYPDALQVLFAGKKTIDRVVVYSLQDDPMAPQEPTDAMTFSHHGLVDFDVEGWTGTSWVLLGRVTGNSLVKRTITFPPVGVDRIYVNVTRALGGYTHITEVEAWSLIDELAPPTGTNHALSTNGAVASASSSYSDSFGPSAAINGETAGRNWGRGSGWNDATVSGFPDWLQVDFNGAKTIDRVVVYTLQDQATSPSEPAEDMTFNYYGVVDFTVQAWNGSGWVDLAAVTGNNRVKRTVSFAPVSTDRIRIMVTNALGGYSHVTEVEAWGY